MGGWQISEELTVITVRKGQTILYVGRILTCPAGN